MIFQNYHLPFFAALRSDLFDLSIFLFLLEYNTQLDTQNMVDEMISLILNNCQNQNFHNPMSILLNTAIFLSPKSNSNWTMLSQ